MVSYDTDPFEFCRMPSANIRELDLTIEEIKAIRDLEIKEYNIRTVRDIFMLSYYLGGINLVDLLNIDFKAKTTIEYYRKKTRNKKQSESKISFTIQPEAKAIIDKYISRNGKLVFGKYDTFGKCYSVVSRKIAKLAKLADINKRVVYYSARKSFVQHGFELGISLKILEYCIGQSMKTNRPIFNYVKIMRKHADEALHKILDSVNR
ncbi:integrase [uncultured Bacteroides sp.]|uniref:integrase n=1 Tax=uncultured Bacteroides sp. TaxID=162156 RepID=UPI002AA829CC|nr:integrase [uncultured Bacteroides sp.]